MTAGVQDKEIAKKEQRYQVPNVFEVFPGLSSCFSSFLLHLHRNHEFQRRELYSLTGSRSSHRTLSACRMSSERLYHQILARFYHSQQHSPHLPQHGPLSFLPQPTAQSAATQRLHSALRPRPIVIEEALLRPGLASANPEDSAQRRHHPPTRVSSYY